MPSLPPSYTMGRVVFSALVALGDIDADRVIDYRGVNGTILFTRETPLRRSGSVPAVIVSHTDVTGKVHEGDLVSDDGTIGAWLTVGNWIATFRLSSMNVPATRFEVREGHTQDTPLDLAKEVVLPSSAAELLEAEGAEQTKVAIRDTGDGGFVIVGTEWVDDAGDVRSLSITENDDGSIDMDVATSGDENLVTNETGVDG